MRRRQVILSLVIVLAMAVCFSSCGSTGGESAGVPEKENVNLEDVYAAYVEVLEQNENAIRNYSWQMEANSDFDVISRQTSLCDINNDSVPELFFFAEEDFYAACLNIYTYKDGQAVKLDYTVNDRTAEYGGDNLFHDVAAGSGFRYVIYTTTDNEHNKFILYYSLAEGTLDCYRLHEYELDENAMISEINVLENEYDHMEDTDLFWQNGESISSEEFADDFRTALESIDEVIMYSGHDDTSIWGRFDTGEALSRSYDEMIEMLSN